MVKINTLDEKEIRAIGDAFADHEYDPSEYGMAYLGKSRQAVSDYICAYVRMAINERILWSTSEQHEAFIAFNMSDKNMSLSSASALLGSIPRCVDISHVIKTAKGAFHSGKSYKDMLTKLKIPYIYVGMVAVKREHQHKGYMRKVLEAAFEEGRKHAVPVILETDAVLKRDKYAHLGMQCAAEHHYTDGVVMYDMVYEPDNMPKEWKKDTVIGDIDILCGKDKNIWDRFAPVYSSFVTGTPGNRKAYEAMYRRIRKKVSGKDVLEIATGPGMIAKQVADSAKSITATDFSEKMLAVARRGIIPSNLTFEQADASCLPYEDDSYDVVIIANALNVIPGAENVLSEIRRVLKSDGLLIAPNFIHDNKNKISEAFSKALALSGVKFESKWDDAGYIGFLEENGFDVVLSKRMPSTIPLMYTECRCR